MTINLPAWIQAGCGIAIAFITGFYAYYARRQAGEMQKAAQAAKQSADAAKASADALVSIERAWLIPEQFFPQSGTLHSGDSPNDFTVYFSNYGNTPGWIVEQACRVIKSPIENTRLVDDTSYGVRSPFPYGIAITPRRNTRWKVSPPRNETLLNSDELLAIQTGQLFLFVCGFVRYKDISDIKDRETYFCFRFYQSRPDGGHWSAKGCPPEANRHT